MNTEELRKHIEGWANQLKEENQNLLNSVLSGLKSAYPFNEYEYMLMFLSDKQVISFKEYEQLRTSYVKSNKYLEVYGLAPRIFGQKWCNQYLMGISSKFQIPNKTLNPTFVGEYDLWLQGIKIEVKAGRATKTKKEASVISKAIGYKSDDQFWMNMQQIKLDICDIFIFIGVWVDKICCWVLTNEEVKNHPNLSTQHRGGIEHQIGITQNNLSDFDKYLVEPTRLVNTILRKADSQK